MDKKIILAVAGAGKTTLLLNKLKEKDRFLIVTYTKTNYEDLKKSIVKRFSYIPSNIKIYTYFVFLYSFCFKPFEVNLCPTINLRTKGLKFKKPKDDYHLKSTQISYYMEKKSKKMYSNRLARLCNKEKMFLKIKHRLEKYFDYFFIDEIQDLAGNDFNFVNNLTRCNINTIYVGDFYQHTFDTSRDGNVNVNLHKNIDRYIKHFKDTNNNLEIDLNSLKKSIRCKKEVCEFIRNNLNIEIYPSEDKSVVVKEIVNQKEIDYVMNNDNIIKLFYQNSKLYKGNVENWGNSKGSTYNNVCVVLNQNTYNLYKENNLKDLKMATRNKLYVACTRTKNNLFFVEERKLIKYKKEVDLCQI